jgi:polysaccharide biosynthesis protein PslH
MNLLIIAPQNCYPPKDGGKIGIYYPIIHLKEYFNIHYAFITQESVTTEAVNEFQENKIQLHPFYLDTKDKAAGLIKNAFSKQPYKFQKYFSPSFLHYLENIFVKEKIDAVWTNHCHMAEYGIRLKKEFGIKIYLREHNIEYSLVQQLTGFIKNPLKRILAQWQFKKTKRYEINAWRLFEKTFFISDSDFEEALKNIDQQKAVLLFDSFDEKLLLREKNEDVIAELNSFIFTGNIGPVQNKINLQKFINEIWMPFVKTNADYKLYITGNTDDELEAALGKGFTDHNIINLGFVSDLQKTILSKQFFISPTFIGSGIRIKVLNAMASGAVCFITGIDKNMLHDINDMEHAVIFNSAESFAKKVKLLSNDKGLYNIISKNAKQLVQVKMHSWESYALKVKEEIG